MKTRFLFVLFICFIEVVPFFNPLHLATPFAHAINSWSRHALYFHARHHILVDLADFRGARGSNAGDQFHELWALEQILALLDPGTELAAVTVEGIVAAPSKAGEDEPHWDGVNCALYFGHETLERSQRVEICQLKYSSSDPNRSWSVARLTSNSVAKGNNSILRKLATDYRDARARMQPGSELVVRLVSNQPVAQDTLKVVQKDPTGITEALNKSTFS